MRVKKDLTYIFFLYPFVVLIFFTISSNNVMADIQRLAVSTHIISNTVDGSARSECKDQVIVDSGKQKEIWLSYGRVMPDLKDSLKVFSSISSCREINLDKIIPYIKLKIIMNLTQDQVNGNNLLNLIAQINKFSMFNEDNTPVYKKRELQRTIKLKSDDYTVIPVLIADQKEKELFNIKELFILIEARLIGQYKAEYGGISIISDMPGADIIIDGGIVGRTKEKDPFILNNIKVGEHEIIIRDFSGREARQKINIERGKMANISLNILNISPLGSSDLIPLGKNKQGYEEYWRVKDGAILVTIPAGEYIMGSQLNKGAKDEQPQRQVFVSEILMDKTEVTWRQYKMFSQSTGKPLPPVPLWGTPDDYPVSNVIYEEALAYCQWVGGRLPTEAEWEKAAKGQDERVYPWGNKWDLDKCNSFDGGPHRPVSVASFDQCISPYGVLDMAGNVWEWCLDWYSDNYPASSEVDPRGPKTGIFRVKRGGSWINMSQYLRTTSRHRSDPNWRNVTHGFRCVQDVPKKLIEKYRSQ